jgi:hypothetical protein
VKLVIVGEVLAAATVNVIELVADPAGAVTPIVPLVAPAGTVTTSFVGLALDTVAAVPLNVTASWLGVAENPVPKIATAVPVKPTPGENEMIDTCEDECRSIDRTLPTAS